MYLLLCLARYFKVLLYFLQSVNEEQVFLLQDGKLLVKYFGVGKIEFVIVVVVRQFNQIQLKKLLKSCFPLLVRNWVFTREGFAGTLFFLFSCCNTTWLFYGIFVQRLSTLQDSIKQLKFNSFVDFFILPKDDIILAEIPLESVFPIVKRLVLFGTNFIFSFLLETIRCELKDELLVLLKST